MKLRFLCSLFALGVLQGGAQTPVIQSIVNVNLMGVSADSIAAVNAWMYNPAGMCYDKDGRLFITDYRNACVRMVDGAGMITTFAGHRGLPGNSGDGGPASAALLYAPVDVSADGAGNVFIVDSYGYIRKVNSSGIISTIAGGGSLDPIVVSGVRADSLELRTRVASVAADGRGNVYFATQQASSPYAGPFSTWSVIGKIDGAGIYTRLTANSTVRYMGPATGDGGPAAMAVIHNPSALAVDAAGNIYFADRDEYRIRKINSRGIISTYAGTGLTPGMSSGDGGPARKASLAYPVALEVDNGGNVYVYEDNVFTRVRRIERSSGIIETIAGGNGRGYSGDGGDPLLAKLNASLGGLAFDSSKGTLVLTNNGAVRVISGMPKVADMNPNVVDSVDGLGMEAVVVPAACVVYPNPVGEVLHVDGVPGAAQAELRDVSGRVCKVFPLVPGSNAADVRSLQAGLYVLTVTDVASGSRQTLRVTKVGV